MLQDVHIHLQELKTETELTELLYQAEQSNIQRLFCNGIKPNDWERVLNIAQNNKNIVPFFGVHPWNVDNLDKNWFSELKRYLMSMPSGIGEIGLDKTQNAGDFETQKFVFKKQIELAIELNRPFIIHCVRAWGNLLDALKPYDLENHPFIIHCFLGPIEVADKLIKSGAYLSASLKLLSDKNQHSINEVFEKIPVEKILAETDYPYVPRSLETAPYSVHLKNLYLKLSKLKQIPEKELEQILWYNGTKIISS
ncbi:MAG: TatD family hydrolase [Candidatus Omnitrophica bacterium]|nr:TatD family hydrolase [Candidatus Omnitrophota bacterium]